MLLRRFTGESTPYKFKKTPIRLVKEWKYPFDDTFTSTDFSRADEHKDPEFYVVPRFVYHIDEASVSALTNYYKTSIKTNSAILDTCSSWVSHYPLDFPSTMSTIKACGLNKFELMANDQLTGGFEVRECERSERRGVVRGAKRRRLRQARGAKRQRLRQAREEKRRSAANIASAVNAPATRFARH